MTDHIPGQFEVELTSGAYFDVTNPAHERLTLNDVAEPLAKTCRYGGACVGYFCVTPETPVLTADLRWVPAGDLPMGERLFAPQEFGTPYENGRHRRRRAEAAFVTHVGSIKRRLVRLHLEDGSSVRSSVEHPWLCATKASGNQRWCRAGELAEGVGAGQARYIVRYLTPWRARTDWEAGYVSGLYDGEGCVSFQGGSVANVTFGQNPGAVLERLTAALKRGGFRFSAREHPSPGHRVVTVKALGGWAEALRLLGTYRPERLVDRWVRQVFSGEELPELQAAERLRVVGAEYEGDGEVTALSTTSGTYFADGFAAHNSVAEHSVLVALKLRRLGAPLNLQLAGLHHDDPEFCLSDIQRPVKLALRHMLELGELGDPYAGITRKLEHAIWRAFGQGNGQSYWTPGDEHNGLVKAVDNWACTFEARHIMPSKGKHWDQTWRLATRPMPEHDEDEIHGWEWRQARDVFTALHYELVVKAQAAVAA